MESIGNGDDIGEWPQLLPDILELVIERLHPYNIADIARLRCVCSSWRFAVSVADRTVPIHSASQLPWLMLPYPLSSSSFHTCIFFSLSSSSKTLHLPHLCGKTYHGTNHGWLFVLNSGIKTPPFLFNPFTQSSIFLPPLPLPTIWKDETPYRSYNPSITPQIPQPTRLPDENSRFLQPRFYRPSVAFAVLSADPSAMSSDFVVMAIHGRELRLSFLRAGDSVWTHVVNPDSRQPCKLIRRLAHWNSRFYAIDDDDNLVVVSITAAAGRLRIVIVI